MEEQSQPHRQGIQIQQPEIKREVRSSSVSWFFKGVLGLTYAASLAGLYLVWRACLPHGQ